MLFRSLDSPIVSQELENHFFFVSSDGWEFTPGEDLDDAPQLLRS